MDVSFKRLLCVLIRVSALVVSGSAEILGSTYSLFT